MRGVGSQMTIREESERNWPTLLTYPASPQSSGSVWFCHSAEPLVDSCWCFNDGLCVLGVGSNPCSVFARKKMRLRSERGDGD